MKAELRNLGMVAPLFYYWIGKVRGLGSWWEMAVQALLGQGARPQGSAVGAFCCSQDGEPPTSLPSWVFPSLEDKGINPLSFCTVFLQSKQERRTPTSTRGTATFSPGVLPKSFSAHFVPSNCVWECCDGQLISESWNWDFISLVGSLTGDTVKCIRRIQDNVYLVVS